MPISINQDLCCADAFCLKVCPAECFSMETGKASLTKSAHLTCILCGQCVSICPTNAIEMNTLHANTKNAINTIEYKNDVYVHENACTIDISKEQFITLAKNRRSIRHFKKRAVELEVLKEALDVTRYAPTAKNTQAVEWIIVDGREKVDELNTIVMDFMRPIPLFKRLVKAYDAGLDPICRGASTLVFNHCPTEFPTQYGEVDCTIAITHLDLFLPTLGLGSCWAGYIVGIAKKYPPLKKFLHIPEDHTVYSGLMIGYPTLKYKKIPQRKPLSFQIIH